jgi:hypothetical protein
MSPHNSAEHTYTYICISYILISLKSRERQGSEELLWVAVLSEQSLEEYPATPDRCQPTSQFTFAYGEGVADTCSR